MKHGQSRGSATTRPQPSTPAGTADQDLKILVDSIILGRRNNQVESLEHALRLVASADAGYAQYFNLLLTKPDSSTSTMIEESPVQLGSYLASRLVAEGFGFTSGIFECMYALSDAVKHLSSVDILRWQFVLSMFVRGGFRNSAATRLLSQTRHVLETLSRLSPSEDLQWEKAVLRIR